MNTEIWVAGQYRHLSITHKRIRNLYLRVTDTGDLTVTASYWNTEREILEFVYAKEDWIAKADEHNHAHPSRCHLGEKTLWVLGREYPCIIQKGTRNKGILQDDQVFLTVTQEDEAHIKLAFNRLAKQILEKEVQRCSLYWESQVRKRNYHGPVTFTFKDNTSRWGSCVPSTGEITLSYRLAHVEPEAIEAVIWHEYAHLIWSSHGKRFHALVEKEMPDYKEREKKLF